MGSMESSYSFEDHPNLQEHKKVIFQSIGRSYLARKALIPSLVAKQNKAKNYNPISLESFIAKEKKLKKFKEIERQ